MANKVQIEILLNFDQFETNRYIGYEVVVNNNNHFTKDKLECPYCNENIDVKFTVLEEYLTEDFDLEEEKQIYNDDIINSATAILPKVELNTVENENTEVLKESLLNELYDFESLKASAPLVVLPDDYHYISDSDETLSTCSLLNIKYQKEIEDAIDSMKIDALDESSLINFIEENTIINDTKNSYENEQKLISNENIEYLDNSESLNPIQEQQDPDSTKHLSEEESNESTQANNFHLCPCKRVYKSKKYFLIHMKQYHPGFSIEDCEILDQESIVNCSIPKTRDGDRPIHRCHVKLCEKVYWSRRSYRRHMVCCHPEEAKKLNLQAKTHRCQYCDKVYYTSELLNQHLLLHVNPDHYQCQYCNKSFATHNNLKRHINAVHLRIKSYICEVCGVRFNQRYSLRLHHQELHGKDGRYECNDCGKTYGTKDKLKCHINCTHQGYGKVKCTFCEKTFLVNNYKRHLRDVHKQGQQLEYPCRYCEKVFNRRAYRDIHECTHTGEKRFPCNICNERFIDPGYRYAHVRRYHSPEFQKRKRRIVNKKNSQQTELQLN